MEFLFSTAMDWLNVNTSNLHEFVELRECFNLLVDKHGFKPEISISRMVFIAKLREMFGNERFMKDLEIYQKAQWDAKEIT